MWLIKKKKNLLVNRWEQSLQGSVRKAILWRHFSAWFQVYYATVIYYVAGILTF